jgi:hypothetical protein
MASILIDESFEVMESEEYAVRLWRRDQFVRLGFDPNDSLQLADSPADLGQARCLRGAGCPVDLAFSILI